MTITKIKSAALENVIRIHGNSEDQKPPEVIDVNINTNLTLSNSKGSKFAQKSLFLLVLFFTGTFTILLFNVRRELQALKSQEQCVENKIAILTTKYEKVSNQLSRVRSHMNYNKYYQPLTTSEEYATEEIISAPNFTEETSGKYNELNAAGFDKSRSDETGDLLGTEERQDLISESNSNVNSSFIRSDDSNDSRAEAKDSNINFMEYNKVENVNRFARTILNVTDENYQADDRSVDLNFSDDGTNLNSNNGNDQIINTGINDDDINLWSEPRTRRMRRDDERRGKIRTKKKRRPNRSRRRLGPLVATFIGGIPEQHITDTGAIGPWVKMSKNTSNYDLQKFHLVDNRKAIEITMNGLYMISAQIFYVGEQTNYSYWILLTSEGQSTTQRVAKCSAVSSAAGNGISCHTNVVLPLRRGDRLHLQQQERDRLINLREGHSYVQLVLLSDETQRKHRVI